MYISQNQRSKAVNTIQQWTWYNSNSRWWSYQAQDERGRKKWCAPLQTARSALKCNWEVRWWIPSTGMAVLLLWSICNWYLSVLMARTLSKKETVNQDGAPSSKMKALQEINEGRCSLLLIHKASASSLSSSCNKPQLQTPKDPKAMSKSLLEECAPLLPLCPL